MESLTIEEIRDILYHDSTEEEETTCNIIKNVNSKKTEIKNLTKPVIINKFLSQVSTISLQEDIIQRAVVLIKNQIDSREELKSMIKQLQEENKKYSDSFQTMKDLFSTFMSGLKKELVEIKKDENEIEIEELENTDENEDN